MLPGPNQSSLGQAVTALTAPVLRPDNARITLCFNASADVFLTEVGPNTNHRAAHLAPSDGR